MNMLYPVTRKRGNAYCGGHERSKKQHRRFGAYSFGRNAICV